MARLLRITEAAEIVDTVLRRRNRRATAGEQDTPPADAADPGAVGDSSGLASSAPLPARHASSMAAAEDGGPGLPRPDSSTETTALMATQPGSTDQTVALVSAGAEPPRSPDGTTVVRPAAAVIPAGTVLASRYRLEELLAGSDSTVTWRAFDQVLSRSVLVHLLPPRDPGAVDLLTAARDASVATDSRFLRVLDAVYSQDPHLGSYIVCEYATGQSLATVLRQGPLSGLQAAWVTREVADALSGVHQYGLYHRRISPETVIVTPTGNVKIVGLLIEATLRPAGGSPVPGADTPELVDVLDLGRLLYAALVARWPGGPDHGLPDAPVMGRGWMTPRQVRAGVSPALDTICDQILGDPPRHREPALRTANDVVNALTKLLGSADASSDLERRLRQPVPVVSNHGSAPVSPLLSQRDEVTQALPVPRTGPVEERTELISVPQRPAEPAQSSSASGRATPVQTTVIRSPAPPAQRGATGPGSRSRARGAHATSATRVRARRWIGVLVAIGVLFVVAGLVYALALRPGPSSAPNPSGSTSMPGGEASGGETPGETADVAIESARDFDPQGDTKRENPRLVKYAIDGESDTRWQTKTYRNNPKLGGLKRGVGLVLDLGQPQSVGSVKLLLSGNGTDVEVRVPKEDPETVASAPLSSDSRWRTVSEATVKKTATLALEEPVRTRFVLVYLTELPKAEGGYLGGIYEVEIYSR
jgi:putative peptidoglycan lipid II flippase